MLTSATKRFILPFSNQKSTPPEAEAAAVFAVAEHERNKGGGLITRQPEEKLSFLTKSGYPVWLFPKENVIFAFDGFNDSSINVSYTEVPPTKMFMDSLEANLRPREKYTTFLSNHNNYFQPSANERHFLFRGLIVDLDFKKEFNVYRKEAKEASLKSNMALLSPVLEEAAISSTVSEFGRLQSQLREEAESLPECVRLINKTTSQYAIEIDYEASAAKEESEAKIKAQEELVNPQIAKVNKEYNRKIKELTVSFDKELESLKKTMLKTQKAIESNEVKIKLYRREAKAQAAKKHAVYEKKWKQKTKQTEKELKNLKKELKKIEDNIKRTNKQRSQEISEINYEREAQIKRARQPIVDLEVGRNAKMLNFKLEKEKIFKHERPVIESLNKSIILRETINANFERLGSQDQNSKAPTLFYVPFYVACYEVGLARRYLIVPPSTFTAGDFSVKLKGALGISKIKDQFMPRFKVIAALIGKVQGLTKQNSIFETRMYDLGQRNNFLKDSSYVESVKKGLVYLMHQGWLSDKEQQTLSNRLSA
ncbi:MAG: hypothetical protein ACM3UN_02570 [Bacillota bacterium]